MRIWTTLAVLLLCLALAGLGCGGSQTETSQQLTEVVRGDLIVSVSAGGNIVVSDEAKLAFSSGGKIGGIYVDKGDEVRKGEVLARLDAGPLELALTQAQLAEGQAKATIDQAEYTLEQAEEPWNDDDIDWAEAVLDWAEDELYYAEWWLSHAEWSLSRAEKALAEAIGDEVAEALAEVGLWRLEVEQCKRMRIPDALASLLATEAQLEAMLDAFDEVAVEAAESQLTAAKSQLKADGLAVTEAQKQLDEAVIIAPFDGVVTDVYFEEGNTISAATTIINLIILTNMELAVEVDEIDIVDVKVGQRALIEVDALPALQLEGNIISISTLPKFESGIVLYTVKIGFDAPPDSGLKIDMSAIADIIIVEQSNVLLVPSQAISQDSQGKPVVKVMANGNIEERLIVTGISDGFDTEIVDGLNQGDVVVIE